MLSIGDNRFAIGSLVEIQSLKSLSKIKLIVESTNDVINKHRNKPKDIITVPKKEIFIVSPYLGIQSKIVTQQLKSCIYKFYGCFNTKIIFRDTRRIKIKILHKYLTIFTRRIKGRISRFSACPYTDWPVHAFWHRPRFLIVYEPIVSKFPNFACK